MTGCARCPPGDLGGVMKCGTTSGDGGDIAVCGWADHGSVVMAMFPGRSVDDAGGLLRDSATRCRPATDRPRERSTVPRRSSRPRQDPGAETQ